MLIGAGLGLGRNSGGALSGAADKGDPATPYTWPLPKRSTLRCSRVTRVSPLRLAITRWSNWCERPAVAGVTAATALVLARVFGNSPDFWLNVQRRSNLWEAMNSTRERERIERAKPLGTAS